MPTAKIDTPVLQYQHVQKTQPYGLGQMAKDALGVVESGKGLYSEGKGLYDWMTTPSSDSTMAADNYASGGFVYDANPKMTEGPEPIQMPVAKLNAPELSFASSGQNTSGGLGIGDAVKSAAGLAGAAKTLWDVGSTVGPALMALSDRRLKTGVSGYDSGGRVGYLSSQIHTELQAAISQAERVISTPISLPA